MDVSYIPRSEEGDFLGAVSLVIKMLCENKYYAADHSAAEILSVWDDVRKYHWVDYENSGESED